MKAVFLSYFNMEIVGKRKLYNSGCNLDPSLTIIFYDALAIKNRETEIFLLYQL